MPSLLDLLGETWPARMAKSAWSAAKLPGDVYAGRVDPLSDEGIGRAADLGGLVMGGTFAGAPAGAMGAGAVKPIRAYHGSPHDFERFDLSKIGTGEGAQAYGHGLYFAEHEPVAQSYRDALAGGPQKQIAGAPYDSKIPEHLASSLLETFARKENPRETAIAALKYDISNPKLTDAARQHYQSVVDLLASGKSLPNVTFKPSGRMYEVNINAAPEQFLDWDKPLAQQSHVVRDAMKEAKLGQRFHQDPLYKYPPTGAGLYRSLSNNVLHGAIAKETTGALSEAGIPGIKYLDQGSRVDTAGWKLAQERADALAAKGHPGAAEAQSLADAIKGSQTSNYVLFRDDIIDIVKKYGLAGAAAMYGISQDEAKAAMDGGDKGKRMSIGRQSYGDEE